MKNKKRFTGILSLILIAIVIIPLIFSCKKKEETQVPPTPTPTPTPVQKDVFTDPKLNLLSEYEIGHQKSFNPGKLYQSMKPKNKTKSAEGLFDIGFDIFSTIQGFANTQAMNKQFSKIDSSLSQIQSQLNVITADITDLMKELQWVQTNIITADYDFGAPGAAGLELQTIWGDTASALFDNSNFTWYSYMARMHNSGSAADSSFIAGNLKPQMRIFAQQYVLGGTYANQFNVYMSELKSVLLGTETPPLTPACMAIARNIVSQNSSSPPITQYQVLENYFMQTISYQFMGYIMQLNCDSVIYPENVQSDIASFKQTVEEEVTAFLKASNFLDVSLYDYRNQNQFMSDIDYLNTGISPDTIPGRLMARAQFVANLLYDAVGYKVPVICGGIVLPYYYSAGTGATPLGAFNVSIAGVTTDYRDTAKIRSPFPYTYWTMSGPGCSPDNQWVMFNYGNWNMAEPTYPCTKQTIQILNAPWGNTVTPGGTVTPLWYNPNNPNQTSTTKTSSCTIQFAYFSASWKWGYMGPCFAPQSQLSRNTLSATNTVLTTTHDCNCLDVIQAPWVQQFHSSQCKWEGGGSVTSAQFGRGILEENLSGYYNSYSDGQIYATEFYFWNATVGDALPGGSISLFTDFNYNHTCQTGLKYYWFKIGTDINLDSWCGKGYNCNGSVFNTSGTGNTSRGPTFAEINNLSSNTLYRLGFEIEMAVWETKSTYNYNFQTNIYSQYVFMGRSSNY